MVLATLPEREEKEKRADPHLPFLLAVADTADISAVTQAKIVCCHQVVLQVASGDCHASQKQALVKAKVPLGSQAYLDHSVK